MKFSFYRTFAQTSPTIWLLSLLLTLADAAEGIAGSPTDSESSSIRLPAETPHTFRNIDESTRVMAARIDALIDQKITSDGIIASEPATDAEFMRRAYLDLAGKNPEATSVVEFLESTMPEKRLALIDELLDSQALNVRLANVWATLLLPPHQTSFFDPSGRQSLRNWLQDRFAERQRYDRIVGDLLTSEGSTSEQPTAFFVALELNPEKLATKASRVFLGSALDCAQCHDHPFDDYKQSDFWGVAAYFAQIKPSGTQNPGMMQSAGLVDSQEGEVTLPDSSQVVSPKPLIDGVESLLGTGTRRQQLAIWLTSRENERFSRAAVNRFWALLMGRGLVEPVDDMGQMSTLSHPQVMDELTDYFRSQKFSIRKLIAAIVSTDAYARSSKQNASSESERYSSMLAKPLDQTQLTACLRQLARETTPVNGADDSWSLLAAQIGSLRGDRSSFAGGIVQSLVTQHSGQLESLWDSASSKILLAIDAPHLVAMEKIDWLFLATLSRRPTDLEIERIQAAGFENLSAEEQKLFLSDLLWAVVNSTEFSMTP
jgi:hypothetical protein